MATDPSSPPSDQTPSPESRKPARRGAKKRRWIKRLLILTALLAVAAWALNGPVFRWALRSLVPDKLQDKGITLEWAVSGTLWSGVHCRDISVTTSEATGVISSTRAETLGIGLDWWSWIRGNSTQPVTELDLLAVNSDITLPARDERPSEPTPQTTKKESTRPPGQLAADLFKSIRGITRDANATIEIDQLTLSAPSIQALSIKDARLTVDRDKTIRLTVDATSIADFKPMLDFELLVALEEQRVQMQRFQLGDAVRVPLANLVLGEDDQLRLSLESHLFGGNLQGQIAEDRTFAFKLADGAIDFDAIDRFLESLFDKRLFMPSGAITRFSLDGILGKGKLLESIEADARLEVTGFALGKREFGDISLHAGARDAILSAYELSVKAPHKSLEIKNATLPVSALKQKRSWTQITTESLQLEVADLHGALAAYHVRPGTAMPPLKVSLQGTTRPAPTPDAWYPHATLHATGNPLDDDLALNIDVDVDSDGSFESPIGWKLGIADGRQAQATPPAIAGAGTFTIKSLALTGDLSLGLTPEFPLQRTIAWSGGKPVDGQVNLDADATFDMQFGKNARYNGNCKVSRVKLTHSSSLPDLKGSFEAGMDDGRAYIRDLAADIQQLNVSGGLEWHNKRLKIPRLNVTQDASGATVELTADLPFPLRSITSPDVMLKSTEPVELRLLVNARQLSDFDPLFQLAGLSSDALGVTSGAIDAQLEVTRTKRDDHAPSLELAASVEQLRITGDPIGDPIHVELDLLADKDAQLNAVVNYGQIGRLKLASRMPWEPISWVSGERKITREGIEVDALVESLPLAPFASLAPIIQELKGALTVQAKVSGSIDEPVLSGMTDLQIAVADFDLSAFPGVRDLSLKTKIDNNQLTISDGTFQSAGGEYQLGGGVDLTDLRSPVFDLQLKTNEALVYRDQSMTVRADSELAFTGTLAASKITGDVGLVRPLYYKEFNILSTDSTGGARSPHQLPTFTTTPTNSPQPTAIGDAPAPSVLESCELDVRVTTLDRIRVRTDIVTADAVAAVQVGGSLKKPELFGEAKVLRGWAQLPFTRIDITEATAVFRPAYGYIPRINVQAQCQAAQHTVQIFVSGSAKSPQVIFTSTPYLPRQDIITLLATGSTSSELEGGGSAALKAVMLLSQKLAADPDQSRLTRWLAGSLRFISNIDVGIGETNRLTGKTSNSAEAELTKRLRFRVEYDESDSRAALIYSYPLD